MNLTKHWHSNKRTHPPKRVSSKPKISWKLLGLPDPEEEQKAISMDEVRRQVVLMSSGGLAEAIRSQPSPPSPKGNGRKKHAKSRRGPTE